MADDSRQDRKRRIIQNAASRRIVRALVVSARPERADDGCRVDGIPAADVVADGIIDKFGRVAVVRGFLRLEFRLEGFVFLGDFSEGWLNVFRDRTNRAYRANKRGFARAR
jgi:hypothetical protein